MNRFITSALIAGLFILSFERPVFASRARELALGTGDAGLILNGGSLYYDTEYNIFYNPSYVNDFKNFGIIEKSNFPGLTAQGGFINSFFNFSFGVYMNRRQTIAEPYATGPDMRPIEILLGSDMGVKWGVSLATAGFSTEGKSDSDMTLRGGIQFAEFEPFFSYKLKGTERIVADNTYKGWSLGTRYKWGEWVPYIAYRATETNGTLTRSFGSGIARNAKLAEGIKTNTALGFFRSTAQGRSVVPLDFSVEADPAVWLTLRAGLSYRIFDRVGDQSQLDSTTGRLGAGFHVGRASFDWTVGRSVWGSEGMASADPQTFDLTSGFFTAASMMFTW
ncbi:hypothetical protein WDW86_19455 [Bdellovibrionota bacterium FG-2]